MALYRLQNGHLVPADREAAIDKAASLYRQQGHKGPVPEALIQAAMGGPEALHAVAVALKRQKRNY